jgi:hypothetical protein
MLKAIFSIKKGIDLKIDWSVPFFNVLLYIPAFLDFIICCNISYKSTKLYC